MKKFYAVKVGRTTGILPTWDECKNSVLGYPNAVYKSFSSEEEALQWLKEEETVTSPSPTEEAEYPYAYVDGSFNPSTGVYGYGVLLCPSKDFQITYKGSGNDPEMKSMRNVAGEILGATRAIKEAMALGLTSLTIFYDYMGIEMWANGEWKANKSGTRAYKSTVTEAREKGLVIHFQKVKAHSGIAGNETVDRLAKEAVGIN